MAVEKKASLRAALDGLATQRIGLQVEHYVSIASTNVVARQRAQAGVAEGLLVVADEQTAGRGRLGRTWVSPPGQSLALSVVLRPALPPADLFLLTMLAGVALCEAVEATAGVTALLKWPNDLLLAEPASAPTWRKAAGILAESSAQAGAVTWVVVGIGVNIAATPAGIIDDQNLAERAISVSAAAGRPIARANVLRALVERFDARYQALPHDRAKLFSAWRARLHTLGRAITVQLAANTLSGVAEGVDTSGALLVRDAAGRLHVVTAGDVAA